jgi:putative ABC transport system ATP-binding protein
VYLGETDVVRLDPLQLRRRVALVPQKPFMFQGTVLENLQRSFGYLQQIPPGADSEELRHALEASRLDRDFLGRDARSLSLGEQQRVSLARALITRPEVLLLDEPTSALDRRTAEQLGAAFQEISRTRRLCVIMVTHDLQLAGRIADYCLYLEEGRVLEEGSTVELLARPQTVQLARFLAEPPAREV